jgi:hypothetical protein
MGSGSPNISRASVTADAASDARVPGASGGSTGTTAAEVREGAVTRQGTGRGPLIHRRPPVNRPSPFLTIDSAVQVDSGAVACEDPRGASRQMRPVASFAPRCPTTRNLPTGLVLSDATPRSADLPHRCEMPWRTRFASPSAVVATTHSRPRHSLCPRGRSFMAMVRCPREALQRAPVAPSSQRQ